MSALHLEVEVMADRHEELEALIAELHDDEELEPVDEHNEQEEELEWEWAA